MRGSRCCCLAFIITVCLLLYCLCLCVQCCLEPWLQLLGDSLGFVPLLAPDEDVNGLLDEVHVQVELRSLKQVSADTTGPETES